MKAPFESLQSLFALPNDDPRKTLAVALALCLVCSVVVSATAVALRPLQERNAVQALQREVLKVAGLADPGTDPERTLARIELQLLDLDSATFVEDADPLVYAYRDAARDPVRSSVLGDADIAGIGRRPDRMPVYLVRDAGVLRTVILPVYGAGLWSTMHGLLAVAPDGRTARGLSIYEQRETAGLGSEVASARWLAQWPGKTLIGTDGEPVIRVAKDRVRPDGPDADRRVDGLSGATLTGQGVTRLLRFWLGARGYGPFLARLAEDQAREGVRDGG